MFDKIKSDMVKAMKEQDKFRLSVIRMIKGSIDKEPIFKLTKNVAKIKVISIDITIKNFLFIIYFLSFLTR